MKSYLLQLLMFTAVYRCADISQGVATHLWTALVETPVLNAVSHEYPWAAVTKYYQACPFDTFMI